MVAEAAALALLIAFVIFGVVTLIRILSIVRQVRFQIAIVITLMKAKDLALEEGMRRVGVNAYGEKLPEPTPDRSR